jgi:putative intracellular protease/amidase
MSKALFIFTETSEFAKGEEKQQTGWYLPEAAHPHEVLKKNHFVITFASPIGQPAHVVQGSVAAFTKDQVSTSWGTKRRRRRSCFAFPVPFFFLFFSFPYEISTAFLNEFVKDGLLQDVKSVKDLKASDFQIIFYPGGHGPMFDLASDKTTAAFTASAYDGGAVVGAVCHGPAALVPIVLQNGEPLVKGKQVACFTNDEENAVKLSSFMPFALESKLRELGGISSAKGLWQSHAVTADRLVTGQNPASGTAVGEALVAAVKAK